jgi:DNA polymerase I-like protein with 3'-5' exonuclease and polymerase domains
VDVETRDPELPKLGPGVRRDGYVVGVSFAIEDGPSHYLPVRHNGGDNLQQELVWEYLRDQARAFRGEVVGANLQYDLDYLLENYVDFGDVWYRDVQVAEPLLDEYRFSYSLDSIAEQWKVPAKDETDLRRAAEAYGLRPKADLWLLPARYVGAYAERDVTLPLELLRLQEAEIERQGMRGAWDLESQVLPVALRMRRRGVKIDQDRLAQLEVWAIKKQRLALEAVRHLTRVSIGEDDVMSAEACYPALEQLGVERRWTAPTKSYPNGQLSLTSGMLESIDHPVSKLLLWSRQCWKTRTTYCESFKRYLTRGRIHPTFNQCKIQKEDGSTKGTVSRRGSMDHPNFQQLTNPDKHPILGRKVRELCIPEDGMLWCSSDFSSQEPRIAVHFSVKLGLRGARAVAEEYRRNPRLDLYPLIGKKMHPEFETWWNNKDPRGKLWRGHAKTTFLAQLYGQGSGSLCKRLGFDTVPKSFVNEKGETINYLGAGPEGQAVIDAFDSAAPFAREFGKRVQRTAEKRGFIRLPDGGRRRYGPGKDYPYKAGNGLVQGSASLQTKCGMIAVDRAGHYLQLQVHDEICLSIRSEREAREIADIMVNCFPLEVPSSVDVALGPNWGSLKDLKPL